MWSRLSVKIKLAYISHDTSPNIHRKLPLPSPVSDFSRSYPGIVVLLQDDVPYFVPRAH